MIIKKKHRMIFLMFFLFTYILSGFEYHGYTTPSEWAQDSIWLLSSHDLLTENLLEDDKYQDPITREEFAELAVGVYIKAKGTPLEKIDGTHPFLDTSNLNIGRAYNLGIIKGISDRRFAPNKEITRQEIATILWRQANIMDIPTKIYKTASFRDMYRVSKWAKEAVSFCSQEGLMMGIGNNRIAPSENTTREQAMVLMTNMGQKYGWFNPNKTTQDFETLENGYLIPNKTELLIRMNEATKLHLQLITDPYAPRENLRSDMEEILVTLKINKIPGAIVMKIRETIESSWHEAYNAPVLNDYYIVDLDDDRRIELRCEKGIDLSIYTPLFHSNVVQVISDGSFKQLANGYYIPTESKLFIQSDDTKGIRLNLLTRNTAEDGEIYNQMHQMLDILKINKIPQDIIQEIERKVSSCWDHIENRPGKIEITYQELPDGDCLVYSSDSYMQVKIFHMDR
jgi:hypothetical protein